MVGSDEKKEEIKEEQPHREEIKKETTPPTKSSAEPFKSDVKKTEIEIPKEMLLSKSFDTVLSSAIEKRKKGTKKSDAKKEKVEVETNKDKTDEPTAEGGTTDEIREGDKVTFTVRCPGCKNVFSVEKTGDVTNIKCPKCGKAGVVK